MFVKFEHSLFHLANQFNPTICSADDGSDDFGAGGGGGTTMEDPDESADAPPVTISDDPPEEQAQAATAAPEKEDLGVLEDPDEEPAAAAAPDGEPAAEEPKPDEFALDGFEDPYAAPPPEAAPIPPAFQAIIEQNQALAREVAQQNAQTQKLFADLLGEARQKQERAAIEARKPQPPQDETDPVAWARYEGAMARYEANQRVAGLEGQIKQLVELTRSQVEGAAKERQQFEQARRQMVETQQYEGAIAKMAQIQDFKFLQDPDWRALFDVAYERFRAQHGGKMVSPLPLAKQMAAKFKALNPSPAAAVRDQQKQALQARREKARTQDRRPQVKPSGAAPGAPKRPNPMAIAKKYGLEHKLH